MSYRVSHRDNKARREGIGIETCQRPIYPSLPHVDLTHRTGNQPLASGYVKILLNGSRASILTAHCLLLAPDTGNSFYREIRMQDGDVYISGTDEIEMKEM